MGEYLGFNLQPRDCTTFICICSLLFFFLEYLASLIVDCMLLIFYFVFEFF